MIRRIVVTAGLATLLVATVAWTEMEIRGVVSYVDPATRTVHFTDGRAIQIPPGATLTINGQPVVLPSPLVPAPVNATGVAISQLRPGDEILVQVRNPARVATPAPVPAPGERYPGSALPYQSYADTRIEAADVQIMWSPQTP